MSRARLLAIAAGVSALLALGGLGWHAARFGWSDDVRAHLQDELTARVAERARAVEATATRVSRDATLIAAAAASRDRVPELFASLSPIPAGAEFVSATIWIPTAPEGGYRALAWTEGPAEDLTAPLLNRAPALLAVTGATGLRLVFVRPVERDGKRVGIAAAETLLSIPSSLATHGFLMASTVGPIPIEPADGSVSGDPTQMIINAPDGAPLVRVSVPPDQVDQSRRVFRWRIALVAAAPWVLVCIALLSRLDRRRRTTSAGPAAGWSIAMVLSAAAASVVVLWLMQRAGIEAGWIRFTAAAAALGVAAVGPGSAWRSVRPIRRPRRRSPAFLVEQLTGGAVLAAGLLAVAWLFGSAVSPVSTDSTHLTAIPASASAAADLASLLLIQVAMAWAVASTLGALAARWSLSWRSLDGWIAFGLWLAPGIATLIAFNREGTVWPVGGAVAIGLCAGIFGLLSNQIRRHYRHTSEARRLVLQFWALLAAVLAIYPLAAASADQATRQIIEDVYAPATQAAQQPDVLSASLTAARADIDAITDLPDLLREAGSSVNGNPLASRIWNRTALSRERLPSQIELYGPQKSLVSRFALNVPQSASLPQSSEQNWTGDGCEWDAFVEVAQFGAGEPLMLHAERGLCGAGGEFLGAIVIRIAPDYRTLPFVTSANPYYDALGSGDTSRGGSRVAELQVAVYGWSLQPQFTSGRVIWPIDEEMAGRMTRSHDPFWIDRPLDGRTYRIRFLSDRGGIYAVGYPAPTPLQHATRLAESAAMLGVLFVLYLAATVVLAPLLQRQIAPLGRLLAEIRASFYRKLFLVFVLAAVGPVVLFAISFGTYMTRRLQEDVKSEASSVVLMARRVLDALGAAQTPVGQPRPAPDDNVMVWIRQVVDQDVNLFEGPSLLATSQRDLFNSGFLPTRTPAEAYRQIALARNPVFVAEDRLGTFSYIVAAAPVPALGRDMLITVPLASRQRDIERQTDELTQGVLTGAVLLVLFAAALGASVAARVSDPVARLTRATRLVAAGRYDERLAADTADELGRLVQDFNTMTRMLATQRAELARANQLKAWAEMARQVAHEIKNPLTPIQLAAEHLQRVHDDARRPLGNVVDQCLTTILKQVRLLRQIASEFSTFAGAPTARMERLEVGALVRSVVEPYATAPPDRTEIRLALPPDLPAVRGDRTLLARALTNLVENALQAMPNGGLLRIEANADDGGVEIRVIDNGVGMDDEGVRRAFEPYFSTKTGGSGLGLANAKRNIELCGGRVDLSSRPREGTTVTVRLLVEPPAARARA